MPNPAMFTGAQPGSSAPAFFGNYSMFHELFAEDPNYTPPTPGTISGAVPNNGSAGGTFTYSSSAGPNYEDSLIGGRPGFDFLATSNTANGDYLQASSNGNYTDPFSVIVVGRLDQTFSGGGPYFTDCDNSATNRAIIGALHTGQVWRAYANSGARVETGTVDTDDHVFVAVFKDNDTRFYIDGTLIGTDASGAVNAAGGLSIGADESQSTAFLNGAVSYAALFEGDITAQSGYADWLDEIQTYYSIA